MAKRDHEPAPEDSGVLGMSQPQVCPQCLTDQRGKEGELPGFPADGTLTPRFN